jgi:WD40 repeat protein
MPAPFPTETAQSTVIEPTVTDLPPIPAIAYDADALRLWGDKAAHVTLKRLGKGNVEAIAVSPDGKRIAVMGLVSVSTYEFDTLKEIWTSLLEPIQPPESTDLGQVIWSPDSGQLATLSEVGITVWDAKTGEQLLIFKGDQYALGGPITWTPDSKLAILASRYGNTILREVQTGTELFNIETNEGPAAADFLPDKDLLAYPLPDQGIVVLDTRSQQQVYPPLKVCDGYCVNSLRLSPDGTRVAAYAFNESHQVGIWDMRSAEWLFTLETPQHYSTLHMEWSRDNKYLAAAFDYSAIWIWDAQEGRKLTVINMPQIRDIAWSADGETLVILSQYEFLSVWDIKTGKSLRSLSEHTSQVMDLAWSPDGSMLASGAEDGEIAIWEPTSGKRLKSFYDPKGWVRNLTWSPDGKQLATGGVNKITIWNVGTGEQVRGLKPNTWALVSLAWSPDGSMLASISDEGTPILWDPVTSKQLRVFPTNYGNGNLVWSPQGDLLSTSDSYNGFEGYLVTLWNPHTGEAVLTYKGVDALAWSPLADIVASISDNGTGKGSDDTTVVLWDPRTGAEVRSFDVGTLLFGLDWSPDGKYLVAEAAWNTQIILDAMTGEQVHKLGGHYSGVARVAWSPRGDFIASSSSDGTVIIWRIGK